MGGNALSMKEGGVEWPDWFVVAGFQEPEATVGTESGPLKIVKTSPGQILVLSITNKVFNEITRPIQ